MSKVIVIGGGAAGMMAACVAADKGHQVTLLEKNEKLGKKIYITGKGRCNVTNAADMETLFENVVSNPKFLYSAFYGFDNKQVMHFMEANGCPLKIERGERVFPVSDHASDIIAACKRALDKTGVEIHLNTSVKEVLTEACVEKPEEDQEHPQKKKQLEKITGVILADGRQIEADAVIVATGGLSYPTTGSTGDGMRWAQRLGHKVKDCSPALVPFRIREDWVKQLQGLALKNVRVVLMNGKKKLYDGFGEMLFTHFGVSGPLILSASSFYKGGECTLTIDLKPALSVEQLDKRLLRDFDENKNKSFKNALSDLFPNRLIPVMIQQSGIDPEQKVHEITREQRQNFVQKMKALPMTVTGIGNYNEAIITRGGVSTKDINPSTMESKKIAGLYFAGETVDLDALTGGFNLQIAWSTGWLAGSSIE